MNGKRTFAWSVDEHLARDAVARIFDGVRQRYLDASRHYHDWDHVRTMLHLFVSVPRDMIDHPKDVIAAIVFHDAIYDPTKTDNEEASARLATEELAGLPGERRRRIADLILATDHRRTPTTPDEELICDIDLAILGADARRYDEYATAVRAEYAFVPEDAWTAGRAKVLKAFLDRPQIFRTHSFQDLEESARRNLKRELQSLDASTPAPLA